MSLSLKRLISIEKLMIHSASVILNQVILLTLSLKVLLAALVHWFFLCPCAFFQTEKFLRFIVAENEKSCQRLRLRLLKPTHKWKPLPASDLAFFGNNILTSMCTGGGGAWWW